MSTQITTAFVSQFRSNVFHLSQQKGSRLKGAVRNESQKGDKSFWERVGSVTATKQTSRHADTPLIDTPHSRRMVTLSPYKHADLIDDSDRIKTLIDPTSSYAQAFGFAFGRAMDDEIISAALGNANTGVDGATSTAHPNTQKIVSVSGAAGADLNVQALRRAKKKFDQADVDPSIRRYIACQASQIENLLTESEVTSADFNTVKALVRGEVNEFMGFTFIRLERLNTQSGALTFDTTTGAVGSGGGDADGYRRVICWAEDGILLSMGQDITAKISERNDKNHSTQVFMSMDVGAVRMEEEKVVEILCNEA